MSLKLQSFQVGLQAEIDKTSCYVKNEKERVTWKSRVCAYVCLTQLQIDLGLNCWLSQCPVSHPDCTLNTLGSFNRNKLCLIHLGTLEALELLCSTTQISTLQPERHFELQHFTPVSEKTVQEIISGLSSSTCSLDVIPPKMCPQQFATTTYLHV